jgi:hypothetical protein
MRKGPGSVTTSGTYPLSFVTQILHSGQPGHGSDRKTFEVTTSTLPRGTLGSVASLAYPSEAHDFTLVFSGVRVLCVWFVDRCLSFCTFSFSHCDVFSQTPTHQ